MRKIILTESQAKLLLEEVDKNDTIQKLIFCNPYDIEFKVSRSNIDLPVLIPIIGGKEINERYVKVSFEEIHPDNNTHYVLHIEVNPKLRRLGIAYKIYLSLILKDYPICNLYPLSEEIKKLWLKLANESGIVVSDLINKDGNKIGIEAYLDVK